MANQRNVGAVLIIVLAAVGIYGCNGRPAATHSQPATQAPPQSAMVELSRYGDIRTAHGEPTRLVAARIDSTEHKITEETQRFQIAPGEHILHLYYGAMQQPEGMELSLFYPQAEFRFRTEAGQTYRVVGKTTGIGSSSWTSHEILDSTGRVVAKAPAPATLPATQPAAGSEASWQRVPVWVGDQTIDVEIQRFDPPREIEPVELGKVNRSTPMDTAVSMASIIAYGNTEDDFRRYSEHFEDPASFVESIRRGAGLTGHEWFLKARQSELGMRAMGLIRYKQYTLIVVNKERKRADDGAPYMWIGAMCMFERDGQWLLAETAGLTEPAIKQLHDTKFAVLQAVPATQPAGLGEYLPLEYGAKYTYASIRAGAGHERIVTHWTLQCVAVAAAGDNRLGVFDVSQGGQSVSRLTMVELPPKVWFVALPRIDKADRTADERRTVQLLDELATTLKDVKELKDVSGSQLKILGVANTASEKRTAPGYPLRSVPVEGFTTDPLRTPPAVTNRWGRRGGECTFQRGVGLLSLSSGDQTVVGHMINMDLVAYTPARESRPQQVDLDKSGKYQIGPWHYEIIVETDVADIVRRKGRLSYDMESGKTGIFSCGASVHTPWGIMFNQGDGRSWLPVLPKYLVETESTTAPNPSSQPGSIPATTPSSRPSGGGGTNRALPGRVPPSQFWLRRNSPGVLLLPRPLASSALCISRISRSDKGNSSLRSRFRPWFMAAT